MTRSERADFIKEMRLKRMTYKDISVLLGVSRQRIEQIANPERYKAARRSAVTRIPDGWEPKRDEIPPLRKQSLSGIDFLREKVRIRDNRTCQICFLVWKAGMRRFDVHHMDETMEGTSHTKGSYTLDKQNLEKLITLCHKCHLRLDHLRPKFEKQAA